MEERIKQRLIGATVLIALAVIFVPIILEGPEEEFGPWGTRMPEPPVQDLMGDLEPLALPEGGASEPVERVVIDESGSQEDAAEPDEKATADVLIPPPEEPGEKEGGESPAVNKALRSWIVQVGSFRGQQNALRLRDRLRAGGYTSYVEEMVAGDKKLFRVLVGPELKHSDAQAARDAIAREFKLEGRVTSHP